MITFQVAPGAAVVQTQRLPTSGPGPVDSMRTMPGTAATPFGLSPGLPDVRLRIAMSPAEGALLPLTGPMAAPTYCRPTSTATFGTPEAEMA